MVRCKTGLFVEMDAKGACTEKEQGGVKSQNAGYKSGIYIHGNSRL